MGAQETAVSIAIRVASGISRRYEGLFLSPYLCPAGVPTIGYGATYYEDGRRVTLKDLPITKERAEQLLIHEITKTFLPAVINLCPGLLARPETLGAIVDFAFNLGANNLKISTLRKKINAGDWEAARIEIMKWDKAGGKVLKGLTLRRGTERDYL